MPLIDHCSGSGGGSDSEVRESHQYIELMPGARVTDYMVEAKDFIAVDGGRSLELGTAR